LSKAVFPKGGELLKRHVQLQQLVCVLRQPQSSSDISNGLFATSLFPLVMQIAGSQVRDASTHTQGAQITQAEATGESSGVDLGVLHWRLPNGSRRLRLFTASIDVIAASFLIEATEIFAAIEAEEAILLSSSFLLFHCHCESESNGGIIVMVLAYDCCRCC
jgi:hypothetical protein